MNHFIQGCPDLTASFSSFQERKYVYVFVYPDAAPAVAGAPGAPMDVTASDANKDYVLVSWKPPNLTNEAPITGYFVDRLGH